MGIETHDTTQEEYVCIQNYELIKPIFMQCGVVFLLLTRIRLLIWVEFVARINLSL